RDGAVDEQFEQDFDARRTEDWPLAHRRDVRSWGQWPARPNSLFPLLSRCRFSGEQRGLHPPRPVPAVGATPCPGSPLASVILRTSPLAALATGARGEGSDLLRWCSRCKQSTSLRDAIPVASS